MPKKTLLIGDIHLRIKSVSDFLSLKEKVFSTIKTHTPQTVIFMGDLLDTNDIVRVSLHEMITDFIAQISEKSKVFILIGNHDYSSPTQYLTNHHIFNPLKKWDNVWVVDEPLIFGDSLMMPYVPPGRFADAIFDVDFSNIKRIFCHQSFLPLIKFAKDTWTTDSPRVYSGHIHDHCFDDNIFYTGSSLQVSCTENPDKKLWILTSQSLGQKDLITPIPVEIKGILTIKCKSKSLATIKPSPIHHTKIVIRGTKTEYKKCKGKDYYKALEEKCTIEWNFTEESLKKEEKGYYKIDYRAHLERLLEESELKLFRSLEI